MLFRNKHIAVYYILDLETCYMCILLSTCIQMSLLTKDQQLITFAQSTKTEFLAALKQANVFKDPCLQYHLLVPNNLVAKKEKLPSM